MTKSIIEDDLPRGASAEGIQRTLDLARRALRAQRSLIRSSQDRSLQDVADISRLEARLTLDDPRSTVLVVEDDAQRVWSQDDRQVLRDLADMLATEIRLRGECEHQRAIVDNLPGLVYERRKTGPAEARYTFIGQAKTALPAVRELMDGGIGLAPLRFVHRDDRDAVRSALLRSTVEESDLDLLFRIKDFDQKTRWVRSVSVARRDAGGLVWSGLCIDVTDLVSEAANRDASHPAGSGEQTRPVEHTPAPARSDDEARQDEFEDEPLRILIADDLDLNRKLIADMLSLEGWVTETVADGAAAVEAARTKPYDLILMDMIMPGMDGLEATRAIRALSAPACDVPIVALTAHSFREHLDSCVDAGMNATLVKPMSFDTLLEAVTTWTKRRQAA